MNTKKIISGVAAIILAASFTACGDSENTQESSEALKEDEEESLENVMSQFRDIELENKEIKWLAHYDLNPNTSDGASKKVELEMIEKNTAAP